MIGGFLLGGRPGNFFQFTGTNANIVFDGNSLVAGVGASGPSGYLYNQVENMPFLNGTPVQSFAVGGQTTADMRSRGWLVDAAYVAGKRNILIAWEGTNSIYNSGGMPARQAADDMALYLSDRRAAHSDWTVILLTTIARQPAGPWGTTNAANAVLLAYDDILLAEFRTLGADYLVHVRKAGSPFAIADFTSSTFENAPYISYEAPGEVTAHIHLNDLGYSVVAGLIGQRLRRIGV